MKKNKLKQLYFPHDIFTDKDEKIIKMFYYFRKHIDDFSLDFIKDNFFLASFGLFWEIVQYLHLNELTADEIPMLADELRTDEKFVRLIIEKFNLFRIENNGVIVSDRILENLKKIKEKSEKNKSSAEVRWLLAAFNKSYIEFFGEEPILEHSEIEVLKQYNEKIENLKKLLPDILYSLKELKFDTDIKFVPNAHWLLKENNLAKLVDGTYGKLKHKPTEKEIREEQKKLQKEAQEQNALSEIKIAAMEIKTKNSAIDFIKKHSKKTKLGILINPDCNELMDKFGITKKNIEEA